MSHPKTTVDSQRSQDRLIEMLVQLSYRFDSNKDGVCSLLQAPTSKRGYCVIVFGFFSFGGTVLLGFLTHFTDISVSVECFIQAFFQLPNWWEQLKVTGAAALAGGAKRT